MASAALEKAREGKERALARLRGLKESSTTQQLMGAGATVAGGYVAGMLDAKVGEVAGQDPSVAAGVAGIVGGVALGQPLLVLFASGMLAAKAYDAGSAMGEGGAK
jgi:hypothetical protein